MGKNTFRMNGEKSLLSNKNSNQPNFPPKYESSNNVRKEAIG